MVWVSYKQCSGSGSESWSGSTGSTCIWVSRIWIRILLSSFYHQAKIVRKAVIPTVLWLLLNFLSLKNDVNIPSKSFKHKNFLLKSVFLLTSWRSVMKIADPLVRGMDLPDPHQNVTDPEHWLWGNVQIYVEHLGSVCGGVPGHIHGQPGRLHDPAQGVPRPLRTRGFSGEIFKFNLLNWIFSANLDIWSDPDPNFRDPDLNPD